jgi:squalene cyclase
VKKGVDFILQHQNKDGGWGESFESCVTKTYCSSYDRSLIAADASAEELERSRQEPVSMVINTAWVLLGLLYIGYHNVDRHIMDRALKFLMSRQLPNGDFPQEGISGVFNGNCMITYTSYRSVFPTWAMGMYLEKVCK